MRGGHAYPLLVLIASTALGGLVLALVLRPAPGDLAGKATPAAAPARAALLSDAEGAAARACPFLLGVAAVVPRRGRGRADSGRRPHLYRPVQSR